jgi:hypothetical protein
LLVPAIALSLMFGMARTAFAQPWVPPAGTGSVTVAAQRIDQTGHRLNDGTLIHQGMSLNASLFVDVDYSVTDRWLLSVALPYVFAKNTDPNPPPPWIPFLPVDQCRCWHSGLQDFEFTAGYNLFNGPFALTSSVSAGLPSHAYTYRGESVLGRHLKEMRLTVDAGHRLDVITPHLSIEGHYSYAIVERVLDIPNNRSTATVSSSYQVAPRISAYGQVRWQRTHGGLRGGSLPPGEVNTPERLDQHDRLLRDNSVHVGGGANYKFSRFDVFGSYLAFVTGTDTHAGRAVTVGISVPFELHR